MSALIVVTNVPDREVALKIAHALIERKLSVAGTARNWNTVLKLAALASQ